MPAYRRCKPVRAAETLQEGDNVKLVVTPGYGWGWFRKDGSSFEVPSAFDLDAEVLEPGTPFKVALGLAHGSQPLSGRWVLLAQRHNPVDGQCNVYVFTAKPTVPKIPAPLPCEPDLTGFASAEISS